jgi:Nucleoside 2-deoxyribosyltransferase
MDRGEFVDLKEAERNALGDLLLRYSEKISPQKNGGDLEVLRIRKLRADPITAFEIGFAVATGKPVWAYTLDRSLLRERVPSSLTQSGLLCEKGFLSSALSVENT